MVSEVRKAAVRRYNMVAAVGYEPTPPKRLVPQTSLFGGVDSYPTAV